MKVLDPQSALLTNAEVYQYLKSKPVRKPDPAVGAYPVTNLHGYDAVRRDLETYTEEVTPHVQQMPEVDEWIGGLVKMLRPYELTKSEVLNLINVGIGVRALAGAEGEQQVNGDVKVEEAGSEGQGEDGDAAMIRDVQFFKVVVEEADERFEGEDGEERIREVVMIMRECILGKGEN